MLDGVRAMKAAANTRVTILRGATTDSFGDPVDIARPVYTGVTASILEFNKTTTSPVDGTVRHIRRYVGRLPAGTDLRAGDRIKDERDGAIYIFDASTVSRTPAHGSDIKLDLRRVT